MPQASKTAIAFFFRFVVISLLMMLPEVAGATKKPPIKPVNINTASSEELQEVPGIGPVTAEKIVQMRKSYGAFKSVDDLLAIHGLGKKRLEKMRKYLTVGKSAAAGKPGACPGCGKAGTAQSKAAPAKSEASPAQGEEPKEPPRR